MHKDRDAALDALLGQIVAEVRDTQHLTGRATLSPEVLRAMRAVPREVFVPLPLQDAAFFNEPLPIGHAQTISQPYIVALMTDLLALQSDHRVLEIGTGSGYQTAVLAQLARQVYSVERIEALAQQAVERLQRLGCRHVSVRVGNGYAGWAEHAPFDAILVTAAAPSVPPALTQQLKPGGRLVIPLGPHRAAQALWLICKNQQGHLLRQSVLPVAFVPLVDAPDEPLAGAARKAGA